MPGPWRWLPLRLTFTAVPSGKHGVQVRAEDEMRTGPRPRPFADDVADRIDAHVAQADAAGRPAGTPRPRLLLEWRRRHLAERHLLLEHPRLEGVGQRDRRGRDVGLLQQAGPDVRAALLRRRDGTDKQRQRTAEPDRSPGLAVSPSLAVITVKIHAGRRIGDTQSNFSQAPSGFVNLIDGRPYQNRHTDRHWNVIFRMAWCLKLVTSQRVVRTQRPLTTHGSKHA